MRQDAPQSSATIFIEVWNGEQEMAPRELSRTVMHQEVILGFSWCAI